MLSKTSEWFWAALNHCLERKGLKQLSLAKAAGVEQSTISRLKNRQIHGSPETREKVAAACGYDLMDFLALGKRLLEQGEEGIEEEGPKDTKPLVVQVGSEEEAALVGDELYRGIPLYESGKLAAGPNGLAFDLYEKPVSEVLVYLPELGLRRNHKLAALRVNGDSMEPTIPKDSIVVVDLSDREFRDLKIFVVTDPDDDLAIGAVKRVTKLKNGRGFALVSDNPNYPPEVVEGDWPEICVGRAVWMWRSLEGA